MNVLNGVRSAMPIFNDWVSPNTKHASLYGQHPIIGLHSKGCKIIWVSAESKEHKDPGNQDPEEG